MLAWDQVAEVGIGMDNSKFNVLGNLSGDFIIIKTWTSLSWKGF